MVAHPPPDPPAHVLRLLRNPRRPSGYACVYLKRDNREQYAVRAFRKLHLTNAPTPRAGALAAAGWWHAAYGPDWPAVFACRSRRAWEVVRCRGPVTAWFRDAAGGAGVQVNAPHGFRLVVWVLGERRIVFPPPSRPGVPSASCFADRDQAKAYFRAWREREFGPRHPLVLRRTAGPVRVPAWALAKGGPGFPEPAG